MSTWKVILATLIIFAAGVITGALAVKETKKPRVKEPVIVRNEVLRRLTQDLALTPEQRAKIDQILQESHERNKILREIIEPELKFEFRKAVEQITAQLDPAQKAKFEAMLRQQKRKPTTGATPDKRRPAGAAKTNALKEF